MKRLLFLLVVFPTWALAEPPADPRLQRLDALIQGAQSLKADIEAEATGIEKPAAPPPVPADWPSQVQRGRVLLLGVELGATVAIGPEANGWKLASGWSDATVWHQGRLEPVLVAGVPTLIVETLDPDWLMVQVTRTLDGQVLTTRKSIEIAGDNPDPPPPPPPNKVEYGMIIEQRSDRGKLSPQQGFIFDNQRIESLFAPGHWRTIDLDKLGPDNTPPDEDIPLINRAKEIGRLPVLWLWDKDQKLIVEKYGEKFPADVDAAIKLIRERQ